VGGGARVERTRAPVRIAVAVLRPARFVLIASTLPAATTLLPVSPSHRSVSTGVLALDEPTTNLDLPNKKGLAQALAKVIELRAGANLQLIVITHDEEFVSELGRATNGGGGSDSKNQVGVYYRVFREQVRNASQGERVHSPRRPPRALARS
jgi:hypothetical protein